MIFQIELAGKYIRITSIYEQVYHMCREYLVEPMTDNIDIDIVIEHQDIEYERGKSTQNIHYSEGYLETLAVYRKIATMMLMYDSWLMHGAVLAYQGKAYMITAVSGTGKTTMIRMALKYLSDSYVVNGDKPLLQLTDDMILACGTPWSGKERMNRNCQVPLDAIIILERGEENKLTRLSFTQAFPVLLQQTYKPEDGEKMIETLDLLSKMGKCGIHYYRLSLKHYDTIEELDNQEVWDLWSTIY